MPEARSPGTLPLRPTVFAILLALNESDLHGYAIMKSVNANSARVPRVGPGTLYRTLKELRELGWISYAERVDSADARRRYYRITPAGRDVAAAEADRMAAWVRAARAGDLLGDPGLS